MSEPIEGPPNKRAKIEDDGQMTESLSETAEQGQESVNEPEKEAVSKNSSNKYGNYVSLEELQKLREFQVLDEVKSNDEDSNDEDSDSSDGKSEGLPDEEIEKMLEEDLPEGFKGIPKPKEKPYVTRQKIVLEEKGINQFEVLPLDWMMVRHCSGMPVYMHRASRVCTLSKPYFLGKGNTRRHEIPISAIPCLAYRRALQEEEKQKEIDRRIAEQIKDGTWKENDTNVNSKPQDKTQQENRTNQENHKAIPDNQENSDNIEEVDFKIQEDGNNVQEEGQGIQKDGQKIQEAVSNNDQENINSIQDVTNTAENCPVITNIQAGNDMEIDNNEITFNTLQENIIINDSSQDSSFSAVSYYQENSQESIILDQTSDAQRTSQTGEINKCPFKEHTEIAAQNNEGAKELETEKEGDKKDDEKQENNAIPFNRRPVVLPGGIVMPPPRVETVNTSWKTQHLSAEQINEYCKNLFKFKTVNIMHFRRWADRRKYTKARKTLQYPTLPEGTKLITIPAHNQNGQENGGKAKRDWVMNMNGCSYLSVFHEYVRRALHKQPVYEFKQLENASSPYQATVFIGGMRYGVGRGSSKRQAKSAAARASIHILIPEMKDELDAEHQKDDAEPDFTFFDYVGIEDPRIQEFCSATSEPSPHAILRTCLLRNFGAQDRHIHTEMKKLEYQKIELTMKVGKHTATVVCKNKKQAKQRASQSILQQLHPHIRAWGSLLRLYGSRSVKSCKEKKLEEQQITLLQDKARHNEPNYAVLEKLRNEMRKLKERDEAVVPIGTLLVADDLPTHSGSNLNNVDL